MSNDKHLITSYFFTHPWTKVDTYLYFLDNSIGSFYRICADDNKGAEKVILVIKGRWLFWNAHKVHFTIWSIYKTIIMWCLNESSTIRAKSIVRLFIFEIFMAKWISKFASSKLKNWLCILPVWFYGLSFQLNRSIRNFQKNHFSRW